jgi:hypothetical protein
MNDFGRLISILPIQSGMLSASTAAKQVLYLGIDFFGPDRAL